MRNLLWGVVICLLISTPDLHAQQNKPVTGSKAKTQNSGGELNKILGVSAVPAKTVGLGLRAGDLLGASLKLYRSNLNFEISLGRSLRVYPAGYRYDNYFYRIGRYSDRDIYYYDAYTLRPAVALQLHVLKQKGILALPGLDFYGGGGLQLRAGSIDYTYRRKVYTGPDKNDWHWVAETEPYTYTDLGLDLVLGLEYTFPDLPFSAFVDGGAFIEFFDDPGQVRSMGALGIRINF